MEPRIKSATFAEAPSMQANVVDQVVSACQRVHTVFGPFLERNCARQALQNSGSYLSSFLYRIR